VHVVVEDALQEDVQIGEVLQMLILMLSLIAQFGQLAERATAIVDTAIGYLKKYNVFA